jgi:hypothetical protein
MVLPPRVTRGNGISFELCCERSSFSRGHETPSLTVLRVMVVSVRLGEAQIYWNRCENDLRPDFTLNKAHLRHEYPLID